MIKFEFESCCVGCGAPMTYIVEARGSREPSVALRESHVPHAHGHLCASCAGQVKVLLDRLREDRAAQRPASVPAVSQAWDEIAGQRPPLQNAAPYRCSVPMCGESGVCDECRRRGAR